MRDFPILGLIVAGLIATIGALSLIGGVIGGAVLYLAWNWAIAPTFDGRGLTFVHASMIAFGLSLAWCALRAASAAVTSD